MKLSKAVKVMEEEVKTGVFIRGSVYHIALELLIEAGKEVMKARDGDPALDGDLLPGETDE